MIPVQIITKLTAVSNHSSPSCLVLNGSILRMPSAQDVPIQTAQTTMEQERVTFPEVLHKTATPSHQLLKSPQF